MYIDLIILIIILATVAVVYKSWSNFVYAFVIIDIFLRILVFVGKNVEIPELKNIITNYFPLNIPSMISKYVGGIYYNFFMWFFAIIYVFFLFYTIRIFIKKSKW